VNLTLNEGVVQGKRMSLILYESFMGIPFAKAPIGDRRWRKPEPIQSFPGDFIELVLKWK
jgi:carboxylesterase type B